MEKRTKLITEFLSDNDIKELTEEAFSIPNTKKLGFKSDKTLLTIAASLALVAGFLNSEEISAKTEETFLICFWDWNWTIS